MIILLLKKCSLEDNGYDNGPQLATLITVKDTFSRIMVMFIPNFLGDLWIYFPRPHLSLFGPFTATLWPLTATNFRRPKICLNCHIWGKWPWWRPPGSTAAYPGLPKFHLFLPPSRRERTYLLCCSTECTRCVRCCTVYLGVRYGSPRVESKS
jgi:hypothetical protein